MDAIAAACAPPAVFTAVKKVSYHYCFYNTVVSYLLLASLLLPQLLPYPTAPSSILSSEELHDLAFLP